MSYYEGNADKKNYFYLRKTGYLTSNAHFHNAIECVFLLDGELEVSINGVKSLIKAGQASFTNSFDVHYYNVIKPIDAFLIVAGKDICRPYIDNAEKLSTTITFDNDCIDFLTEWTANCKNDSKLMLTAKLMYLFANLLKNPQNIALENKQNQLVKELFSYVHQNADKKLTLEAVAEKLGYSRGYLSGLFKKTTGKTLSEYCRTRKMQTAKALVIENKKKIGEIAEMLGYTLFAFSKTFKATYGQSPKEMQSEFLVQKVNQE